MFDIEQYRYNSCGKVDLTKIHITPPLLLVTVPCPNGSELVVQEATLEPSSSSSKILYPEWQHEYFAAIVDLDPQTLFDRVTAAETAIFNRLQAISHDPNSHAERQAIADAVASLRILKRDNLGFPDWEKT